MRFRIFLSFCAVFAGIFVPPCFSASPEDNTWHYFLTESGGSSPKFGYDAGGTFTAASDCFYTDSYGNAKKKKYGKEGESDLNDKNDQEDSKLDFSSGLYHGGGTLKILRNNGNQAKGNYHFKLNMFSLSAGETVEIVLKSQGDLSTPDTQDWDDALIGLDGQTEADEKFRNWDPERGGKLFVDIGAAKRKDDLLNNFELGVTLQGDENSFQYFTMNPLKKGTIYDYIMVRLSVGSLEPKKSKPRVISSVPVDCEIFGIDGKDLTLKSKDAIAGATEIVKAIRSVYMPIAKGEKMRPYFSLSKKEWGFVAIRRIPAPTIKIGAETPEVASAAATPLKSTTPMPWYVFNNSSPGFKSYVWDAANNEFQIVEAPDKNSFVDSVRTAEGYYPGDLGLLSDYFESFCVPERVGYGSTGFMVLENTSPIFDAGNTQNQGYHYMRFEDFSLTTVPGKKSYGQFIVRKEDGFGSKLFAGFSLNGNYLTRDLMKQPPYYAKCSIVFQTVSAAEQIVRLYGHGNSPGTSANVDVVPYSGAIPFVNSTNKIEKVNSNKAIPSRHGEYNLITFEIDQASASSSIRVFISSSSTMESILKGNSNSYGASPETFTVPGGAVTVKPFFSSNPVPAGVPADTGLMGLRVWTVP